MKEYVALMVRARNGGSYLVAHHSQQNYWCFPGGKPEPGETWSQALVREIQEELGITPTAFQYLGTFSNEHGGEIWTGRFFVLLTWEGGAPRIMEPHKFSELRYMTIDELSSNEVLPEALAAARYERLEAAYARHIRNAFEWCRDGRIDKAGRDEMLLMLPSAETLKSKSRIARCSQGALGLITSDAQQLLIYKDGTTGWGYTGIHLTDVIAPVGSPWSSRSPRMVDLS